MKIPTRPGFLELEHFIADPEAGAIVHGVDGAGRIIHLERDPFILFPGMAPVLIPAEHLSERRPLVVNGPLDECRSGRVDACESAASGNVIEQSPTFFYAFEQHARRVVETER